MYLNSFPSNDLQSLIHNFQLQLTELENKMELLRREVKALHTINSRVDAAFRQLQTLKINTNARLDKLENDKQTKKVTKPETIEERFYSWTLQRQLTWGVVVLTCLTGLIQLLPVLARGDIWYLTSISIVYFVLSLGLSYSFWFLGELFCVSYNILEPVFSSQEIGKYMEVARGEHHRYMINSKITKSASILCFIIWLIVWMSKVGLLH